MTGLLPKPMPEISRLEKKGEKAPETQSEKLISQGENIQKSTDAQGKVPDRIQESEKASASGSFDLQSAPLKHLEEQSSAVNAENGNCKPGIWHWMMFTVLVLILGMQILILGQVRKLKIKGQNG